MDLTWLARELPSSRVAVSTEVGKMRRAVTEDAWAYALLTEANRRLEAARAGSAHRVGDDAVGRPRDLADSGTVVGRVRLARRLLGALSRPRRICVE
jgi:hypothetical protein